MPDPIGKALTAAARRMRVYRRRLAQSQIVAAVTFGESQIDELVVTGFLTKTAADDRASIAEAVVRHLDASHCPGKDAFFTRNRTWVIPMRSNSAE